MIKNAFSHLPELAQDGIVKAYSLWPDNYKWGKGYRETRKMLAISSSFDRKKLLEFQLEKFLSVYRHAITNIPFYMKKYRDFGLSEDSIKSLEDIVKIPILTKKELRGFLNDMVYPGYPKKRLILAKTGGSTGRPAKFYTTKFSNQVETAFIHSIWSRIGFKPYDSRVAFMRARHYNFRDGMFQYYSPRNNVIYLSPYHLNKKAAHKYLEIILRKKPKFLWGYSAFVFAFAQIIRELGVSTPRFKGIFCGTQKLLSGQRKFIEEIFGCRVFTWYGMSEKVILAAECKHNTDYHIVPEYGYTELIDKEGRVINTPGSIGELVGTGFYNEAMPLIRYRTGDLASYRENQNCPCCRPHVLLADIKGRTQNFVVLEDGSLKSLAEGAPLFNIISDFSLGYQFFQEIPGKVQLRIVPKNNNPPNYKKIIYDKLYRIPFSNIQLEILEISDLERAESGKTKFLIQKLKTPREDNEDSA